MGARAGVILCVTSFLLGALFTHWIADSLTLWKISVTDEHLWTAAAYYSILAKVPAEGLWALAAIVALGGTTMVWSLNDLRAENIMFDGGSIFLFLTTVYTHTNSVLPNIFGQFSSLPPHAANDPFPRLLRNTTLDLASSNLICSVALTGVLALQASRLWAETDEDDFDMADSPEAPSTVPTPSASEDQSFEVECIPS